MRFAQRTEAIRAFQVMELMDRARKLEAGGMDVVHMEVGEPDFVSADPILEAGQAAIAAGHTGYTSALGLPALRQAVADYYRDYHAVTVDPQRVVITAGASGALMLLSALLLEPGDELLLADPGYPCNRYIPLFAGAVPRLLPVGPDTAYQLDAGLAAAHWSGRTRGMLVATPANPTGSVLARDDLAALAELAAAKQGWLLVDEIYQGLVYPAELQALPAAAQHGAVAADRVGTVLELVRDPDAPVFVLNSFSKYFGMTGWRIGWMVVPESAVTLIERLAQNFYIAPSSIGQHAALAALSEPAMVIHEQRRRAFCDRRNRLVAGLQQLEFGVPRVPEGAFYVYAELPVALQRRGIDSATFCDRLLAGHGVAATPGTDFGEYRAEAHVRFAYTADIGRIDLALERMAAALAAFTDAL
ncbi:MAG: aminotransferase class I/II-fold pyridoxal phosphate-dependent enzyme [Gammaproteobacteria bacterium]|nr:aminotransferase class I/II-fold pyridoxal phosphate-dependent enzyme [Gammaproteobacteria bacterium]